MTSIKIDKNGTTRRGFVKELAIGAGGLSIAGILKATLEHANLMAAQTAQPAAPGELKYRKYFTSELTREEKDVGYGASSMFTVFADNDIIEGCHFFSVMLMGPAATKTSGHGPHRHKDPEVLVALGTDPDHPNELFAEFEMCMGPEMEKHIVNKPSLVYVPANFIHCPFTVTKVTRPFIFIEAQYAPKSIETALRDMVPADMRNKYIFIDSDGSSEKLKRKVQPKMQ
jgi:hypothetical protein